MVNGSGRGTGTVKVKGGNYAIEKGAGVCDIVFLSRLQFPVGD